MPDKGSMDLRCGELVWLFTEGQLDDLDIALVPETIGDEATALLSGGISVEHERDAPKTLHQERLLMG